MNLNSYFDKIFVINLDERKDRWKNMQKELHKHNITNYIRFPAVKPKLDSIQKSEYTKFVKKENRYIIGSIGCKRSHQRIIQIAKTKGYSKILILEDDITLANNIHDVFNKALKQINNNNIEWDMLYFSGWHRERLTPVTKNVGKVNRTLCTHSYAVNKSGYDKILYYLNSKKVGLEIDILYAKFLQKDKCFCLTPSVTFQQSGFSDIKGENVVWNKGNLILGKVALKPEKKPVKHKNDIVVLCHLYSMPVFHHLVKYIKNLPQDKTDVFINLVSSDNNKKNKLIIKKHIPNAYILVSRNKGLDIGGMFWMLKYIYDKGWSYKLALKLHTKTDNTWRNEMCLPIAGTTDTVKKVIRLFERKPRLGLVGCNKYMCEIKRNMHNVNTIKRFCRKNRLEIGGKYLAGSIFWMRFNILKNFMDKNNLNVNEIYEKFEPGYTSDKRVETYTHAWERIIGIIVYNSGHDFLTL